MSTQDQPESRVGDWWRTDIIDFEPGKIWIRGFPIEQLIGNVSFPEMIWLMLKGELPGAGEADLLAAALVGRVACAGPAAGAGPQMHRHHIPRCPHALSLPTMPLYSARCAGKSPGKSWRNCRPIPFEFSIEMALWRA